MSTGSPSNYNRIATAIEYMTAHYPEQPSLETIAEKVHLSPFHFQRMFTEWAGISPKKFIKYLSIAHAKKLLLEGSTSMATVAFETGLSGTGRLHDLFISIEGMTPGNFKNAASSLKINYHFEESIFGQILTAATPSGLCHLAFSENEGYAFDVLKKKFHNAIFLNKTDEHQDAALQFFKNLTAAKNLKLHLKGTAFQLKVWEALLKIAPGNLTTYGKIASALGVPGASRAVGTAIGDNPIAFIIPCHRVIRASGALGGYHWGLTRKSAMIGWESAIQYARIAEAELL